MKGAKNQYLNHFRPVYEMEEDEAMVADVRGCVLLAITAGAGATVTYSRVDSKDAGAHGSDTDTVTTGTFESIPVEWPFYRVSVAGGTAKVAVV